MKVVNLFAPPGSGKSTTAAGVFYDLKTAGINAELTGEYAKDLVWSGRFRTLTDQLYVFGKQHHRVFRLKEDVNVAVVDSPILLGLAYASEYPQFFRDTVNWAFNQYDNINFYINRVKPYNPKGRNQTAEESDAKGQEIKDILSEFNISYITVDGNQSGRDTIVSEVLKSLA